MKSPTFSPPTGPRSTVRPADAGTTLLGVFGKRPTARVDRGGAVQLCDSDWTLDWWIAAQDRIHSPAKEANVRQRRLGAGPVVQTSVRVPGGDIVERAWAYEDGIVVEFENTTDTPVGLTLAVRPYDLAGQPCSPSVRLSSDRIQVGVNDVWLQSNARDTVPELAAAIVPLPHKATTRVFISPAQSRSERPLPASSAAIQAWDLLITDTTRVTLPDARMSSLFDQSRGRLSLSTFDLAERVSGLGGSAGSELAALSQGGFRREAVEVLRFLMADRWHPRTLRRSDNHGAAAEVVDGLSWAITMYAPKWAEEFLAALSQLTSSVAGRGGDRTRLLAEGGLARLVLTLGDPEGARRIDAHYGLGALGPITSLEDLTTHAQAASEAGSWGNDEIGPAAVAVRSLRSLVVSESLADGHPQVALFPEGFPRGWRGGPTELHSVPTMFGQLSAAIRWHGARPALLWEFERAENVGVPVSLRCRSLDPHWVTTDRRGEALLAGSSQGLAEPPTEGQSFS